LDGRGADDDLVARLRAAGSVFAEEEADLLRDRARDAGHLEEMTSRRIGGEMLEHVLGEVGFGGLRLRIRPGCFVPRRRTRLLARLAVAAARAAAERTGRDPVLLELCAGVAPIASLCAARVPGIRLHAADIDPLPLASARRNLPASASMHVGDLFAALPPALHGGFDVIAAVPPYVPGRAIALLPRDAREHEPLRTVHGGADGLDVARRILVEGRDWLAPGGRVLLEMHVDQARTLVREQAGSTREQAAPTREQAGREADGHLGTPPGSWRRTGRVRVHPGADGRTAVCEVTPSPA
jgi:release factor glutamine methyltransferase